MRDRYSNLVRAVHVVKITTLHVAVLVMKNWIILWSISHTIMIEHTPKSWQKIFLLYAHKLKQCWLQPKKKYPPPSNSQTKKLNKTLVAPLRHYINKHQTGWLIYKYPLIYGRNTQVSRNTTTSSFFMVLIRKLFVEPMSRKARTAGKYSKYTPAQAQLMALESLKLLWTTSRESLAWKTIQLYDPKFKRKVIHMPGFQTRDWVCLDNFSIKREANTVTQNLSKNLVFKKMDLSQFSK